MSDYIDGNCKGALEILERLDTDSDTISRAKAIDGKICIQRSNGVEIYDDYVVPVEYLEQLPPTQPDVPDINVGDKMSSIELKPCPFCGGEARIMKMGYSHWIYCLNCGARVHGRKFGEEEGEKASAEAWNRRASDG